MDDAWISCPCYTMFTYVIAVVRCNLATQILLSQRRTSLCHSKKCILSTNIGEFSIADAGGFAKALSFFANAKATHLHVYKVNHNQQHPKYFLSLQEPNSWLCNNCYNNKMTSTQVNDGGKLCIYTSLLFPKIHVLVFFSHILMSS